MFRKLLSCGLAAVLLLEAGRPAFAAAGRLSASARASRAVSPVAPALPISLTPAAGLSAPAADPKLPSLFVVPSAAPAPESPAEAAESAVPAERPLASLSALSEELGRTAAARSGNSREGQVFASRGLLDRFFSGAKARGASMLAATAMGLALLAPAPAAKAVVNGQPIGLQAPNASAPPVQNPFLTPGVSRVATPSYQLKPYVGYSARYLADEIPLTVQTDYAGSVPDELSTEELRKALQAAVGDDFVVLDPFNGKKLRITRNQPIHIGMSMRAAGLPANLEPGKAADFYFPPTTIDVDGKTFSIGDFILRIESALPPGWEKEDFKEAKPWSDAWVLTPALVLLALAAAVGAAWVFRRPKPKKDAGGGTPLSGLVPLLAAAPAAASFANPGWLWFLVPAAGALLWHWLRSREHAFTAPSSEFASAAKARPLRSAWIPRLLAAAALVLVTIGASDPIWGVKARDRKVDSIDTVLLLDRSQSMSGDKILEAKAAAKRFLAAQEDGTNRLALVAFGSTAQLVQEPTTDHNSMIAGVDRISLEDGTEIDAALDAAMDVLLNLIVVESEDPRAGELRKALMDGGLEEAIAYARANGLEDILLEPGRARVVILLTDGESDQARALAAAKRLDALGARVYSMGVAGANVDLLRAISATTKGRYLPAADRAGMDQAFDEIEQMQKALVQAPTPPTRNHHGHEFALAGAALLLLSLALRFGPSAEPLRPPERVTKAAILLWLALAGLPAAEPIPGPRAAAPISAWVNSNASYHLKKAHALYRRGDYKNADREFIEAMHWEPEDPEIALFWAMARRRSWPGDHADIFKDAIQKGMAKNRLDVVAAALLEDGNRAKEWGDLDKARALWRQAASLPDYFKASRESRRLAEFKNAARYNYERSLRPPPQMKGQSGSKSSQQQNQSSNPQRQQGQPSGSQQQNQPAAPQQSQGQPSSSQQQSPPSDPQSSQNPPSEAKPPSDSGQKQKGKGKETQDEQESGEPSNSFNEGGARKTGNPEQPEPSSDTGQQSGKGAEKESKAAPAPKPRPSVPEGAKRALDELKDTLDKRNSGDRRRRWGHAWLVLPPLLVLGSASNIFAAGPSLPAGAFLASTFGWLNPHLLLAALAVPVFAFLAVRLFLRLSRGGERWAPNLAGLKGGWSQARWMLLRSSLAIAALGLTIVAAAGPYWGTRKEKTGFGDQNIVVAVDVSDSVVYEENGAFDNTVTALDELLRWLAKEGSGDDIAVLPFAGSPGEAALSHDPRTVLARLYRLKQEGGTLAEGSDLAAAVDRAKAIFDAAPRKKPGKVLIIVSDGGNATSGPELDEIEQAAGRAQRAGIRIHTLGVGSKTGSRMRVPEKYRTQNGGEFILNQQRGSPGYGQPAQVRLNEIPLHALAGAAGGTYGDAAAGQGMNALLRGIASKANLDQTEGADVDRLLAWELLGPAAVLLLLSLLLEGSWRPKAEPRTLEEDRTALLQEAAKRIRFSDLLHGRFPSPRRAVSGDERAESVPLTREPARFIDHNASARGQQLFAKRFEADPDIPVYLVLNAGPSGRFGSRELTKRRVAAETGAVLAYAAARERLSVGALIFGEKTLAFLPAKRGAANAREAARLLSDPSLAGTAADAGAAMKEVLDFTQRRGAIVVLSDFDHPDQEAWLAAAAQNHVLVPVAVEDLLEKAMPDAGTVALEDASGRTVLLDTSKKGIRAEVEAKLKKRQALLDAALAAGSRRPLFLSNDGNHLERLLQYFASKEYRP